MLPISDQQGATQMTTFSDDLYSDLHKDAYGFRPRGEAWHAWLNMTDEQKEQQWNRLVKIVEDDIATEKRLEAEAIINFEDVVSNLIADGHPDRKSAVQWLHSLHNTLNDNDYLCYKFGIPYGYLDK
jgi:hypothetical protein